MNDGHNPYQTPAANPAQPGTYTSVSSVSSLTVSLLAATKGWVQFISVLCFIGSAFIFLGAFVMHPAGSSATSYSSRGNPFGETTKGLFGLVSVFYILIGVVQLVAGVKLWQYGSAIRTLMFSPNESQLNLAIDRQRSFWKYVGIVTIAILCLYAVGIGLMVFAFSSMRH